MKEHNKPELIIVNKWHWFKILPISFISIAIIITLIAVKTATDIRSKAKTMTETKPIASATVPPPSTDLKAPYIRLVTPDQKYGMKQTVPVEVYAITDGQETVEADLEISFDPELLEITSQDIETTEVYKVTNVNLEEKGRLQLSLFVTPDIGQSPVVLTREKVIAKLRFQTKTFPTAQTQINLEFTKNSTKTTSLILYEKPRLKQVTNILESVDGVSFAIAQ